MTSMKQIPLARRLALAPLLLLATSCLENEEEIHVHADGSLEILVRSRGDVGDLADGAPVPLHAPWIPVGEATERWVGSVGAATSGASVAARVAAGAAHAIAAGEDELELAAYGHFQSAADVPSFAAPPGETFASALLRRDVRLDVRRVGNAVVYSFERTYRARESDGSDICDGADGVLSDEQKQKLEDGSDPGPEAWALLSASLVERSAADAERLVRDALASIYLEGDASLDPAAIAPIVARTQAASVELFTPERLNQIWRALLTQENGDALLELQQEVRDVLRHILGEGLAAQGIGAPVRHAVAERLEWRFAAIDHDADLADESFQLRLTLPGTLVDTNAHERDGDVCVWSFEAEALTRGDVVMRAVSVLAD